MKNPLRVLMIGAHPDDSDVSCGGIAAKYAALGHVVKFVSCTNGATGHYAIGGIELARRRFAEAQASAEVAGISEYQILDWHTGELEPSVTRRKEIIRIMREFRPDVLFTHRPNDYHPDHRATSQLVMDASYIVMVPNMLPLTDALASAPVICYLRDDFEQPTPFRCDVVVDIGDTIETKYDMLHQHVSQFYEWLPYGHNMLDAVPETEAERRAWLIQSFLPTVFPGLFDTAGKFRRELSRFYGPESGGTIEYAEAFEISSYGARCPDERIREIFPFFRI